MKIHVSSKKCLKKSRRQYWHDFCLNFDIEGLSTSTPPSITRAKKTKEWSVFDDKHDRYAQKEICRKSSH